MAEYTGSAAGPSTASLTDRGGSRFILQTALRGRRDRLLQETHEDQLTMRGIARFRLFRAGLIALMLTASGALVAYAALPSASDNGQARAAAGAANGQAANHPSENAGEPAADVADQLSANQERLLSNLSEVVDRLTAGGNAAQNAIDAVNDVIDRLTNDDIGLNRAMDATSGAGQPDLPDVVSNHPGQP